MAKLFQSYCAPPSEIAVQFDLNLPFSRTGERVNFAVLYRIWFGTYLSVPMPYFYSETNEWSKHWAKQRALLWTVTCSRKFQWTFRFRWEKPQWSPSLTPHAPKFLESSQLCKSGGTFCSSEPLAASSDCCRQGNAPYLCSPVRPSCDSLPERCSKSLATEFAGKPSIVFWNSIWKWLRWTQT